MRGPHPALTRISKRRSDQLALRVVPAPRWPRAPLRRGPAAQPKTSPDGKEHSTRETLDRLADHFELTEDEKKRLLPSGRTEVFTNRVAWAKTHLRMAGLIEATARGIFRITPRGREVLRTTPARIDSKIVLIDGEQLWNLMIDFGIGVAPTATYDVKRIDNDYFSEELG